MLLLKRALISSPATILFLWAAVAGVNQRAYGAEIEKVYIGPDNQVRLLLKGNETSAPKLKDQVSCSSPKLSDDKQTAGWLVQYDNCCNSYPLPLTLVIYRHGSVIQRLRPGQSIFDWQFLKDGRQVAFWTGPTHGDFVPHFELHDVQSGKMLTEWNGHLDGPHPAWVSGLKD